jgi:hypothetical protein
MKARELEIKMSDLHRTNYADRASLIYPSMFQIEFIPGMSAIFTIYLQYSLKKVMATTLIIPSEVIFQPFLKIIPLFYS